MKEIYNKQSWRIIEKKVSHNEECRGSDTEMENICA